MGNVVCFEQQKRLRVQLSSRFSSASEEPESAHRSGKRYCSDPEDDASCTRETDEVDSMVKAKYMSQYVKYASVFVFLTALFLLFVQVNI